jgi:hypothetical protein
MGGDGFHYFAKIRAQICNAVLADPGVFQADCHRENCRTRTAIVQGPNLRAERHGPDSSAVFNRTAAVRGKGVINH